MLDAFDNAAVVEVLVAIQPTNRDPCDSGAQAHDPSRGNSRAAQERQNYMNYIRLELDKPITIALKYPAPKPVTGFNGPELRWILIDGQALYTPVEFSDKIGQLGIKPGQRFTIEKRKAGKRSRMACFSHI